MELSYIFLKENFSHIPGNGNLETFFVFQGRKLSYISERNFQALKIKSTRSEKSSYISEDNLQSLKIKKFFYFFL